MQKILKSLKRFQVINIDDYIPFPKPYMGKGEIKAIVLGMDPSTDDRIRFDTVFDLGGNDRRYFKGIERNLNAIGLSMDNVYVQNFCQNYFTVTTYKQRKNWFRAAAVWYQYVVMEELDKKFSPDIPILSTSKLQLTTFIHPVKENKYYYMNPEEVPMEIFFSDRRVFPFYRHWKYNLERPELESYKNKLKAYFDGDLPSVKKVHIFNEIID